MNLEFDTPVQYIKGVGPARAAMMRASGIETVEDLLSCVPMRYEDRERCVPIASLRSGDKCVVKGMISAAGKRYTKRRDLSLFEVIISDGQGSISVKFFNQPYLSGTLREGKSAVFFGEVVWDKYSRSLSILNPEIEMLEQENDIPLHSDRIVPVYRRIDKISGRLIRTIMFRLLSSSPGLPEYLPEKIMRMHGFPGIREAYWGIHFPVIPEGVNREAFLDQLNQGDTPARKRMVYEEFFLFQAGIKQRRMMNLLASRGREIGLTAQLRERIRKILPFKPTPAQKRVLGEIVKDITSDHRMNRLLQGDVGSGKTIVALQAMIVLMENGYQAAFMAPTEILAEQKVRSFSSILQGTPYRTGFISGGTRQADRKKVLAGVASGEINLIVGTHSLIQEGVNFRALGLVVIDEQHRFGVMQRTRLAGKGDDPDILVMSATPIPRSLAMTLYGDLDISLIDQLPPGRKPVKTIVKTEASREEVYALVSERISLQQQVFVVCPLVEESEDSDLTAATETHQRLLALFPSARVGLLHGRMGADEKSEVMEKFRDGAIQILVATTVIEVGIDVPAAAVMIIEHAERFGLSQLHQLRGRVGRGKEPGLCILMAARASTKEAVERLRVMCRSSDGFVIAEKDLEIRGPGDYLGVRQSGVPDFHFGSLVKHFNLLASARQDVSELFDKGEISPGNISRLMAVYQRRWGEKTGLTSSG